MTELCLTTFFIEEREDLNNDIGRKGVSVKSCAYEKTQKNNLRERGQILPRSEERRRSRFGRQRTAIST